MTDCVFCKIVRGELDAERVYEDDYVLAFRDVNPQAPTHVLVVPKIHVATLTDLTPEHEALAGRMLLAAQRIARDEGLAGDGFRTVMNCNRMGGQTVFHIHMHVLGGRYMRWPPG